MYIMQRDLLSGMGKDFAKRFMEISVKESHKKGHFLYQEGTPANHFYVLLKGCVKIRIGEIGHIVYTVDHPGEAFGWSSLLGRRVYWASAECAEPAKLLKIEAARLLGELEGDPAGGFLFFKALAENLGNRLLQTYKMFSSAPGTQMSASFGTGQVMETEATVA
jgi:CRP-like cAMP-binding protein